MTLAQDRSAGDSRQVSQIEPVQTLAAPRHIAAAICRPESIPPAASTGVSPTASTTSGINTMAPISPVCADERSPRC